MNISITIEYLDARILTLRKYGDPFMVWSMGLDTKGIGVGNFQNIDYFSLRGGFGAVTNFQPMDAPALAYLSSIQPLDSVSLTKKLNWLGVEADPADNTSGRPYMVKQGVNCYGTMGFGGQNVRVEAVNGRPVEYIFPGRWQVDGILRPITFFKLLGLRRADMTRAVPELLGAGLIQKATEAFYPTNQYNDTPQGGTIYNPVWSALDWPTNYGENNLYIARGFCEGFTA